MCGAEFAFGQALALLAFEGHSVVGVESHPAQDGVIGCGVAVTSLVVVLAVNGVEHPVTAVFNRPVAANIS